MNTIFLLLQTKLLPGDDMDIHGKLPRVLLQIEQTDVTDSQAIVASKFGPTSIKKPPSTIMNHHLRFPCLPHALQRHSLPASWKMYSSIPNT